jgi:hypothetical protein
MTEAMPPRAVLAEVDALRRRTRADRHAYWLPVLYLGLAHLVAIPLYFWVEADGPVPDGLGGTVPPPVFFPPDGDRIGSYWLAALLIGGLLSVWWYRRRGRRVGVEGRVWGAVLAAVAAVIGYVALRFTPFGFYYAWPVSTREYEALLVVAVGLLALARLERSRGLLAVAVLYSVAAVLANTYNVENIVFRLGWDPFQTDRFAQRYLALPALLLPAAILLAGGLAAGARAALAGRRAA